MNSRQLGLCSAILPQRRRRKERSRGKTKFREWDSWDEISAWGDDKRNNVFRQGNKYPIFLWRLGWQLKRCEQPAQISKAHLKRNKVQKSQSLQLCIQVYEHANSDCTSQGKGEGLWTHLQNINIQEYKCRVCGSVFLKKRSGQRKYHRTHGF